MKDLNFISPFKKLCITIGNLPTAYIESMSYYEGLTFLVNYLANNVIPAVNNNSEVVKELQDQFVILKNYVDNYFDNLDVQEEINTKLDEMADNGELTDIIAQYLGLAGMITFDSVADMKAAQNLVNGSKCQTLGYYNVNDGGNAIYKIRTVTNDDVVDEMFIIEMYDDSLVGELILDDPVNILQLGAKKDNTTDIGNIVNSAISKGVNIFIPDGEYNVENTIDIDTNLYNLKCNGNLHIDNITAISIKGENNNIEINGKIIGNNNGTAINVGSDSKMTMNNNITIQKIEDVENGIHITPNNNYGVQYCKFNFSYIKATNCIYFNAGNTSTPWINENIFNGGRLYGTYGILTKKGSNMTDHYNGNKFLNIGFETISNTCIKAEYFNNNVILNSRTAEIADGIKIVNFDNDCHLNLIDSQSGISITQVTDGNTSILNYNTYTSPYISQTYHGAYIGSKMHIVDNYTVLDTVYNTPTPTSRYNQSGLLPDTIYSKDMIFELGNDSSNITVTLPSVYNKYDLKEFNFKINYLNNPSTLTISDSNGVVINGLFSGETISNKYYTLKNYNNVWILYELTKKN